ncbi:MAG: tetratricopeptide repeat protein [Spirochaetia bacterium]
MGITIPQLIIITSVTVVVLFLLFFIIMRRSRTKSDKSTKKKKTRGKDRNSIIRESNRKLAQNPKDPEALQDLAELYYNDQEWDKAMKMYGILVDLCATNSDLDEFKINLRYGLSAAKCSRYEEAYRGLMFARTKNQELFELNYNLGYIEYMRKNYEKSAGYLIKAREKQPDHIPTLKYLGMSFFKMKKYKEAGTLLRKVSEIHPDDKETVYVIGQSFYELAKYDQALRIFSHLRADPKVGPASALMAGTIRLKNRQYEQAQMDFAIGLRHEQIKPEIMLELKYRLATSYLKDQQVDKALPYLNEIYAVNPKYKDVAAQLQKSKELNSNKNLQTFLIAPVSDFVALCRRIATGFIPNSKTKIADISVNQSEYTDILTEVETQKWEDIILFRFIRTSGVVGELLLRDFHFRIKDLKAGRGYCLTAGSFSETAKQFVEARLIDLIEKDELLKILNRS